MYLIKMFALGEIILERKTFVLKMFFLSGKGF